MFSVHLKRQLSGCFGLLDSNRIIKVAGSIHLGNASIINAAYVAFRYGVLLAIYNSFSNSEI